MEPNNQLSCFVSNSELHWLGCTINAKWVQGSVQISLIHSVSNHVKGIPQGKQL